MNDSMWGRKDQVDGSSKGFIMKNLVERLREAGSKGLDMSPGDPLANEAADEIEKLRKSLASIPCPSCQGFGKSPDEYDPPNTPCGGCKGAGIHPIAIEALK